MRVIKVEAKFSKELNTLDETSKNVLKDLNIDIEEDLEYYWKTVYLNINLLEEEVVLFKEYSENSNNTELEFFDGRGMILNLPVNEFEKLIKSDT